VTGLPVSAYRYVGANGADVAAVTRLERAGGTRYALVLADDPGRAFRRASPMTAGRRPPEGQLSGSTRDGNREEAVPGS
jgi:hypothetical protein